MYSSSLQVTLVTVNPPAQTRVFKKCTTPTQNLHFLGKCVFSQSPRGCCPCRRFLLLGGPCWPWRIPSGYFSVHLSHFVFTWGSPLLNVWVCLCIFSVFWAGAEFLQIFLLSGRSRDLFRHQKTFKNMVLSSNYKGSSNP